MGKLEKSFYWFCFFLAIYITVGFKLIPIILKDQLIKNLDENLTAKTSIEKVEFNPFTISARISNFKLVDENNNSDLSFKELNINFALLRSIEKRHISFQNLFLDELFLNIKEEKDGTYNLANLLKPSKEEDKKEDSSSFDIKFLISKIDLKNADINFESLINERPYNLKLKDINYVIYDLGTYKNSLSSNNLSFRINEDTSVSIGGAFNLEPFKMYGKIHISNLKIKEFLDFKDNFFNFELNNEANINLVLNYNINTTKEFDLKLNSEKLEINNIDLKQNDKSISSLKKLDVKRFDFDLINQKIKLDGINIDTLNANMISDKNGINFANLIKNSSSQKEVINDEKTTNKEESKPWIINLSNIKASSSFKFDDKINNTQIISDLISLNLKNIDIINSKIVLNDLSINHHNLSFNDNKNKLFIKSKNTKVVLDNLNIEDSIIDINNINLSKDSLVLDEKKANLNINSKNISLVLNNLKINKDKISLESTSLKTPNLDFEDKKSKLKVKNTQLDIKNLSNKGTDLAVDSIRLQNPQLDFINLENNTKIEAKNLDLKIQKLSNQKNRFKIEKTDLNNPHISIILPKNENQKIKEEVNSQTNITTKKESNNSSNQTKLDIGPININNGTFDFEDKNLPIAFKTTVTKLQGKVSEIKNTKSSKTNLELKGVVDQYGVAKITGIVNPNNIKFLTDINMKFENIAMQNFTPYTGKFIGRELKSGKLDLDLKYNIDQSNLDAKNNIIITKLELGEEVESPDAISLPLGIAIALLEDKDGIIDINLSVSGNVDDPQFSIGAIVWKAFVNLITKAVTAPFSLLGAMFNFSEDEIKSVKFNPLEDEITPIQKETLDKIALILTQKKDIAIKVNSSYNQKEETFELKKKRYFEKEGENKKLKKEELENLVSKIKVDYKELEIIAKNRALNIKNYLIKEKKIDEKQIILKDEIKTSNSSIDLEIEPLN
ncbi:DUF748 domain-containing protein [Arcobacter aquimarinus]|uniref:DUF748 domain-containing membrane protein n=1 Tax=Arcobacter aquimarinus TaxID=1315211 RepID=A0AAE7B500_9BACT|nr:DUF748 domain-containing protein [Arcobacter aquimarinus]QKE25864.1 DUF748 domain-containing membrane protein [Arcobacter aquimarinus]RXI35633.1 hypothetical protein CP986_05925 [Arcobacter aquimarinus]